MAKTSLTEISGIIKMKTYILSIFTLLIVGCGNQSQPSNDAILDDVTQNFNGETENLDSIRVLVRCTEEAQNYFNKGRDRSWWNKIKKIVTVLYDAIRWYL